jgi:hypothetical protein
VETIESALAPASAVLASIAGLAAAYRAARIRRARKLHRRRQPVAVRVRSARLARGRSRA